MGGFLPVRLRAKCLKDRTFGSSLGLAATMLTDLRRATSRGVLSQRKGAGRSGMAETTEPNPPIRPPDRRKLIAVLYADMVGYSRLIGLDDVGTLQRLRALRTNLIDPAIEEHGGRIVQTGGTPC